MAPRAQTSHHGGAAQTVLVGSWSTEALRGSGDAPGGHTFQATTATAIASTPPTKTSLG